MLRSLAPERAVQYLLIRQLGLSDVLMAYTQHDNKRRLSSSDDLLGHAEILCNQIDTRSIYRASKRADNSYRREQADLKVLVTGGPLPRVVIVLLIELYDLSTR